jgi:hypothetical protein
LIDFEFFQLLGVVTCIRVLRISTGFTDPTGYIQWGENRDALRFVLRRAKFRKVGSAEATETLRGYSSTDRARMVSPTISAKSSRKFIAARPALTCEVRFIRSRHVELA